MKRGCLTAVQIFVVAVLLASFTGGTAFAFGSGARPMNALAPVRGEIPSTSLAIALLMGSGIVGVGACIKLFRKNR